MVVKRVYREYGASILESMSALLLGGVVFLVLRHFDMAVLGAIMFPIIVTIGMLVVSIRSFRPERDSPFIFIFNMLSIIAITLLFFAAVYHVAPYSDQDYLEVNEIPQKLTFSESVYYSTVTITTLGYGDIVPHGLFRAFAATEAILGFIFLGLFVSGLTLFFAKKRT
ncbi:hypothetical protein KY346_05870 [Candidatus Woesearchaeota archaeon]|nr:hypothetical protein [Candidatus Woesearchaeota archaeon]